MQRHHGPAAVWLVRHGESTGNVARDDAERRAADVIDIDLRDMDVPLSERGQEQARALGSWVAERPEHELPDVVFASPYVRTRETAALVLEAAGGKLAQVDVRCDERLRDRDLGMLDRLTWRGIAARYPEQAEMRARVGKFYHRPPGGESWTDVLLRLRSFAQTLDTEYAGRRVLVVTHDVVVMLFRYLFEGWDEATVLELGRRDPVANCGLTTYVRRRGALELTAYNSVAPLAEKDAPVTVEDSEQAERGTDDPYPLAGYTADEHDAVGQRHAG